MSQGKPFCKGLFDKEDRGKIVQRDPSCPRCGWKNMSRSKGEKEQENSHEKTKQERKTRRQLPLLGGKEQT
jgi:hypothetical protein